MRAPPPHRTAKPLVRGRALHIRWDPLGIEVSFRHRKVRSSFALIKIEFICLSFPYAIPFKKCLGFERRGDLGHEKLSPSLIS